MKLEVTKQAVLKGASKCPEAKDVLKEMFPEAFEDDKYFDLSKLETRKEITVNEIFTYNSSTKAGFCGSSFMQIRENGKYRNKAFYLSNAYNWEIQKDSSHYLCLIPTKKH